MDQYSKKSIQKGWKFIVSKLKKNRKGQIYFDFSWEPKPTNPRWCNFIDTSTYFYILDLLFYLCKLNIISNNEYEEYMEGFLKYIYENLIQDKVPTIKPYQDGEDILHYIMPRPSESIFDKGFFLSNVIEVNVIEGGLLQ